MVKILRYLVRKFYLLCAVVLIGAAVLVQGGRSLAPLIQHYPDQVAHYLGQQLDLDVTLGAINAHWEGLKPRLSLHDLRVYDRDGNPLLKAERTSLELSLVASLLRRQLVWGEIGVHSAHLSLTQNETGAWSVLDREAQPEGTALGGVWSLVQRGTRVEFQDTRLHLDLAKSENLEVVAPRLLLESSGDFHRLSLHVNMAEHSDALRLVVEGHGDPSDARRFRAKGHLELRNVPLLESMAALEETLWGENERSEWFRHGRANARLWFDKLADEDGYRLRGHLALDDLTLPIQGTELRSLTTDVTGQWTREDQWQLALQELSALLGEQTLPPVNLGATLAAPGAPAQVMVDRLELRYWADLVDQLGLLGDGVLYEVIHTLQPRGELHNVQLTLPLGDLKDWELAAQLHQVSVEPWNQVPGFTDVSGFVTASRAGGRIDLDSRDGFGMYYAGTYNEPMRYQQANGQVAWHLRPDDNQIYVNSGPLNLIGEGESARGAFWLSLPWERNTGDIDLYIQVATEQMAAPLYAKYLPAVLPETLTTWLHKSLGRTNPGRATAGDFIFRGTISSSSEMARSHQLYLAFEQARLRYDPQWPELNRGKGRLWLDDKRLDVQLISAQIYNSDIYDGRIALAPNPHGEGFLLSVDGRIDGIASDGLRLLRESALQRYVGEAMEGWYMHGQLKGDIALAIPLQADQPGGRQEVTVDLDVPRWAMDRYNLQMYNLRGRIRYTDEQGLSAEALHTTLFGEPLRLAITSGRSRDEDLPQTVVSFEGRAHTDRLLEWSQQPAVAFLKGDIDYQARVELTHRPADSQDDDRRVALAFSSDLEGVAIDLPAPYGKGPASARSTHLNLIFGTETSLIDLHYGDLANALVQLNNDGYEIRRANLALGQAAELPGGRRLHLSGRLDRFDWPLWQDVWERYQARAQALGKDSEQQAERLQALLDDDLQLSARVHLDQHQLGSLLLENILLGVSSGPDGWSLRFANDIVKGQLGGLGGERPLSVGLEYLHLQPEVLQQLPSESEQAFDPSQLPEADVVIEQLSVSDEDYGHWSFQVKPTTDGLQLTQIEGELRGLHLTGLDGDPGAVLNWYFGDDGVERSDFSGLFHTRNIGEVLTQWGQPNLIESQRASYRAQLRWAAPPWGLSADNLMGDVALELTEGRFSRNASGGADGILRLFAVLNFDSLARRLRLDFSDLYQSGLAYDSIRGRAHFDAGQIEFREPLLVRSPSSRMQLMGRIDLVNETLDARLVATLPVASNLTFLTALVGGLPAAAGVYLVSKLFERQVDQATSVSYRISGDWDDPKIKFDRLFEGNMRLNSNGQDD